MNESGVVSVGDSLNEFGRHQNAVSHVERAIRLQQLPERRVVLGHLDHKARKPAHNLTSHVANADDVLVEQTRGSVLVRLRQVAIQLKLDKGSERNSF